MKSKRSVAVVFFLFFLSVGFPGFAAEGDSPAPFFPPHTYLYLEVNPFSAVDGCKGLKLARLLEDPTLKQLMDQALANLPPQADPAQILERYPLHQAMDDFLAFGVVGFQAETRGTESKVPQFFRFPRDGAVPHDLFSRVRRFESENLLAIKIKNKGLFLKTLVDLLTDTVYKGEAKEPQTATINETQVQIWSIPGAPGGKVFTAFHDRFFLASLTEDTLLGAIQRKKARKASLNTRSDITHFEEHRQGKSTAFFMHLGVDSAIDLFSSLIPARDLAEIKKWGGFDYNGLQFGLGFHEGGVCEWFHLAFADNPQGVFLNLARLWPEWGLVEEVTPRGTLYGASLTFDWAALYRVVMFTLDLCEVDTHEFTAEVNQALGMDLGEDLMGALGNTMGALVVVPHHGFIPEISLTLSIRNRVKMEALLERLDGLYEKLGLPMTKFVIPGGGPKGTYVDLGQEIPVKPAYALSRDKLVISTMPLTLKYALMKSRTSGQALVDRLPETSVYGCSEPLLSWFMDPAPMAMDFYADLLKVLDSQQNNLPVAVTDLPAPEFVGNALSRVGLALSMDPYYMSLDLHSPCGVALPMLAGLLLSANMQQTQQPRSMTH